MDADYENAWLVSAEHELDAAQLLLENGGYSEVVGYHVHQALERSLKGFLAARGSAIPAVHDLGELVRRAAAIQPDLLRYLEDVRPFTAFFVETLDDEILLPQPSREDLHRAMRIAWDLRRRLAAVLLVPSGE